MPTYKVKPETFGVSPVESGEEKSYPTVYFPISQEILKTLEVGETVTVELAGKVVGLESRDDKGKSVCDCRIELREVSVESGNEFEELSKEEEDE